MNETRTVEHDETAVQSAPNLAPVSAGQPLEKAREGVAVGPAIANDTPQGLFNIEGRKRKRTWGEVIFDWQTYGGVALLGNEAASLLITTQAEDGITKNWHAKQMAYFKSLEGKKFITPYVSEGNLFKVLIAVLGGMTMVPFIKYLEDHKGDIVRKYDRWHYGKRADTDPALIEAHKEMDEAPKQTWGSLWKGRVLTVFAAIGLDWSVGCKDAQSNKLFKNSPTFQKYANMDRLAERVSNGAMNLLNIAEPARPTWDKYLKQGSWLLVFSGTLTVLFYVSSKLFASRRDHKLEQRDEAIKHTSLPSRDDDYKAAGEAKSTPSDDKPHAQVSDIVHAHTLASAPQLAQGV